MSVEKKEVADLGGRISDRYNEPDLIGRGGMGDLYRGVDTETEEPVAIKFLHEDIIEAYPRIVDRFERDCTDSIIQHGQHPGYR